MELNPDQTWLHQMSQIAQIAIAAAAIVGLFLAHRQIRANRFAQREAVVRGLLQRYFEIGLSYPSIMHPERREDFDFSNMKLFEDREKFLRYEWILSQALIFADECFQLFSPKSHYVSIAKNILRYHRVYISYNIDKHIILKNLCKMLREYLKSEYSNCRLAGNS